MSRTPMLVVRGLLLLSTASIPMAASAQRATATERLLQIGHDERSADYVFGSIMDLAFGPDGGIYVLAGPRVRIFDADGQLVRSFGSAGEGPGEFGFPTAMSLTDSEVRVTDVRPRRLVRFTHGGEHIATTGLPSPAGMHPDLVVPMRDGYAVAARTVSVRVVPDVWADAMALPARQRDEALAGLRREYGRFVVSFNLAEPAGVDTLFAFDHGHIAIVRDQGMRFSRYYWGSGGTWAVGGDSLLALVDAFQGDVRVLKLVDGAWRTVRAGKVPIDVTPRGQADWQALRDREGAEGGTILPGERLSGPPFKARLADAVFSDTGALWLKRIDYLPDAPDEADDASEYLVIPLDGTAQRSVMLPSSFRLEAVRGDLLLGVGLGEFDVQIVELWRDPGGEVSPGASSTP